MAGTATAVRRTVPGDAFRTTTKLVGDTSYPNGTGYIFKPQDLGFSELITDIIGYDSINLASATIVPVVEATYASDGKTITQIALKYQVYASGAEVTNGTNVSTTTVVLIAEGR